MKSLEQRVSVGPGSPRDPEWWWKLGHGWNQGSGLCLELAVESRAGPMASGDVALAGIWSGLVLSDALNKIGCNSKGDPEYCDSSH